VPQAADELGTIENGSHQRGFAGADFADDEHDVDPAAKGAVEYVRERRKLFMATGDCARVTVRCVA
jgi:hypothetical protein